MMKKNKLLLMILVACGMVTAFSADAQPVSQNAATTKAMDFFICGAQTHSGSNAPRKAPQLQLVSGGEGYYIFNDVANGGFVIIGGDERMEEVLAYSLDGSFESGALPHNVQSILDNYAAEASFLRENAQYTPPSRSRRQFNAIAPLLGETAWGQDWPYNLMTPVIDGHHCVTGCVATAVAQVMYYHRWPAQGQGQISYQWNGTTLEADLSQSEYQWNLMTPKYTRSSSAESCNAVALLMRDVGYACHMGYGIGSSGAGTPEAEMATYFDYDMGICHMSRDCCDAATWDSIIINELTCQRPLLYSSGSPSGGHEMVIDGIDNNGYYHFNFGWSGSGNGYYTLSTLYYNSSPDIGFGIQKNIGGKPRNLVCSENDFFYNEETHSLSWYFRGMWVFSGVKYSILFAIENTTSHQVIYTPAKAEIDIDLADGHYIIYPVVKYADEEGYHRVFFHDERQTQVDLIVEDGQKTYQNNHISDNIQEGAVEIDDIYYFLNHNSHEATVTFKNDKYKSYSGDVTIPDQVEYRDETFLVTTIGHGAFFHCTLGRVTIPKNVKQIQSAFYNASVEEIIFAPESQLQSIDGFAFQYCQFRKGYIVLPESLNSLSLSFAAFECSGDIRWTSLPSSINYLSKETFRHTNQRTLIMNKETPLRLSGSPFAGVDHGLVTLYVPVGSGELYRQADYWKEFKEIVEGDIDIIESNGLLFHINHCDGSASLLSAYGIQSNSLDIPSSIKYQGKKYKVTSIHPYAFEPNMPFLQEVTIPSSVKYIGEGAFYSIGTNLERIKIGSRKPISVADKELSNLKGFRGFFRFDSMYDYWVTLHVPIGSKALFLADSFWGQFTNIVEDSSLGRSLDVNSDGAVNISDINKLINDILTGNNNGDTHEDDVNGDGVINISDLNVIIDYILTN